MNKKKPGLLKISFYQVMEIILPIGLHYMIMQTLGILAGRVLDAGTLTTLTAILAFPFLWYFYRKEKRPMRRKPMFTLFIPFLLGIVGNILCSMVMNLFRIPEHFSNVTQENLFHSILWVQVLGLGIWVPFVEELIFRGMVFGGLRKYFGKWTAVGFSALLFALYHGNMVQMLYALPMGILLALVYERWGTLTAPVLFHIGANLFGVVSAVFIP